MAYRRSLTDRICTNGTPCITVWTKVQMTYLTSQSTDTKCSCRRSATSRVLFLPSLYMTCVTSFDSFVDTSAPSCRRTLSTARLLLSHSVRTSTYATTPGMQSTQKSSMATSATIMLTFFQFHITQTNKHHLKTSSHPLSHNSHLNVWCTIYK